MAVGSLSGRWTVLADVSAALRRRWDRGEFLSDLARGVRWEPLSVPVRGPSAGEMAGSFEQVRSWVQGWQAVPDAKARVEYAPIGGRVIGANRVPSRVWFDTREQLWSLLGVTGDVARFQNLLAASATLPAVAEWMADRPMKVLVHADRWPWILATVDWIAGHPGSDVFLRQIDVPGVDTKFIEAHRGILAELLDTVLPTERVDRGCPRADFAGRYRFARKPIYIRMRSLDGAAVSGPFTEVSVRADELAQHPPASSTVIVVENEITYLALPRTPDAIAVLGGGYAVERLSQVSWLADRDLVYWGDIDTHGFAILNRLRRRFPCVRSLLMDRRTLMAHDAQWVSEPVPVNAELDALTTDEAGLYRDLVGNVLGIAVRLEQERIGYSVVERALSRVVGQP